MGSDQMPTPNRQGQWNASDYQCMPDSYRQAYESQQPYQTASPQQIYYGGQPDGSTQHGALHPGQYPGQQQVAYQSLRQQYPGPSMGQGHPSGQPYQQYPGWPAAYGHPQYYPGPTQAHACPPQLVQEPPKKLALGITSIVIGAVALLTSVIPIVNNASFVLAFVGLVLGIIGIVVTTRSKAKGRTLAIVGVVLCVLACAAVLVMQALFVSALDEVSASMDELTPGIVSSSSGASQSASSASSSSRSSSSSVSNDAATDGYADMSIGESVSLKDGTRITVNSVTGGLVNYDDSEVTCVNVTYVNEGTKPVTFNLFEWSGEDAQGARRSQGYYADAENELNSGSLAPGGTVTGNVYFDGALSRVVYTPNMFTDEEATWLAS